MSRRNLAAFTPAGVSMPPFISINEVDGGVEVIVRSTAELGSACAGIILTTQQFEDLLVQASSRK